MILLFITKNIYYILVLQMQGRDQFAVCKGTLSPIIVDRVPVAARKGVRVSYDTQIFGLKTRQNNFK